MNPDAYDEASAIIENLGFALTNLETAVDALAAAMADTGDTRDVTARAGAATTS